MIIELSYTDLKITIEAKGNEATSGALSIWGVVLMDIKKIFPKWGNPQVQVVCGLFCPHCGHENKPIGFLTNKGKCSRCAKSMLRKIPLSGGEK